MRKQQPKGFTQCWRVREKIVDSEKNLRLCFECQKEEALRGEGHCDRLRQRVKNIWRGRVGKYQKVVQREKNAERNVAERKIGKGSLILNENSYERRFGCCKLVNGMILGCDL